MNDCQDSSDNFEIFDDSNSISENDSLINFESISSCISPNKRSKKQRENRKERDRIIE